MRRTIAIALRMVALVGLCAQVQAGERNVDHFGAKGDGNADDTGAINAALADAGNDPVTFTAGKTYRVRGTKADNSGGLHIPNGARIRGNGATVRLMDHEDREVWQPCILRLRETRDVTIEDLVLDGNREHNRPPMTDGDGGGNNIQLERARDIRLIRVVSRNASTDGLLATDAWAVGGGSKEPTDGLSCKDCVFTENSRQGMSVISLRNAVFENCEFSKTSGKAPEAGIDFENNWPHQAIEKITFTRCRMVENRALGVAFAVRRGIWAQDILFADCDFLGNGADHPFSLRAMKEGGNLRNIRFEGGRADGKYILIGTPGMEVARFEGIVIDGLKLGVDTWILFSGAVRTGDERSLRIENVTFNPSGKPPAQGMLVLDNCDGVEVSHSTFPHGYASGIRLKGCVTALTIRDCAFDGRKADQAGNHGIYFVRAHDRALAVAKGVRIQSSRFEHSAWEALLLDGHGDWKVGPEVIFEGCRGETRRAPSFTGSYRRE